MISLEEYEELREKILSHLMKLDPPVPENVLVPVLMEVVALAYCRVGTDLFTFLNLCALQFQAYEDYFSLMQGAPPDKGDWN